MRLCYALARDGVRLRAAGDDCHERPHDRGSRVSLEQVRDNWPKFVITRNDPIQCRSGIVHENATELIGEGLTFGLTRSSASSEEGY